MRAYEYRHIVGFEETNLVGNVYYLNPLRWQGRVRELFLKEHVPQILEDLRKDLVLATVRVACEYYAELFAFDEVLIRMTADKMTQNRLLMRFDYLRLGPKGEEVVARGEQEIACMRREGERLIPTPLPESLRHALAAYR
ncbi:acyl-CoA thioesterase [Methylothermus subterraneus]